MNSFDMTIVHAILNQKGQCHHQTNFSKQRKKKDAYTVPKL